MVEQVHLSVSESGEVGTEEVYDIFFQCPSSHPTGAPFEFLALSPHLLIDSKEKEKLRVRAERHPGSGSSLADQVYGADFDHRKTTLRVTLPARKPNEPEEFSLEGEVLVPDLVIPHDCDPAVVELCGYAGTAFCIRCQALTAGKTYAVRLVVAPVRLVTGTEKYNIVDPDGHETLNWAQQLTIISPSILTANVRASLQEHRIKKSTPEACLVLQSVIDREEEGIAWRPMPMQTHRIFLVRDHKCSIDMGQPTGSAWFVGGPKIISFDGKQRFAYLYAADSRVYRYDDPFECALATLAWVREWNAPPKTMQEIGTSLNIPHPTTVLVVEALERAELLAHNGEGRYSCGPACPRTLQEVLGGQCNESLDAVAFAISDRFSPKGFQLSYQFNFFHASATAVARRDQEAQKRVRLEKMTVHGYWLGVIGTVLAILGILLSFVT